KADSLLKAVRAAVPVLIEFYSWSPVRSAAEDRPPRVTSTRARRVVTGAWSGPFVHCSVRVERRRLIRNRSSTSHSPGADRGRVTLHASISPAIRGAPLGYQSR